jgi:methylamine dehydrogenase accessory protein MauD
MMEAVVAAVVVLSVLVLGLMVAVFALTRQIGILYERIAPMGALTLDQGPAVGSAAPEFDLVTLAGEPLSVGRAGSYSTLLFFLSPTCPVCKKLLPILARLRDAEGAWLKVVLASDGERAAQDRFVKSAKLESFAYVLSQPLGMAFRVSRLPYAVLLDATGTVRAKGLVNSREQIESLFAAMELGVASVQDYLTRDQSFEPAAPAARRTV